LCRADLTRKVGRTDQYVNYFQIMVSQSECPLKAQYKTHATQTSPVNLRKWQYVLQTAHSSINFFHGNTQIVRCDLLPAMYVLLRIISVFFILYLLPFITEVSCFPSGSLTKYVSCVLMSARRRLVHGQQNSVFNLVCFPSHICHCRFCRTRD